jgi:hypothetical protein
MNVLGIEWIVWLGGLGDFVQSVGFFCCVYLVPGGVFLAC